MKKLGKAEVRRAGWSVLFAVVKGSATAVGTAMTTALIWWWQHR
ncbi:hypothetical protein ACFYN3_25025 [Streptomyces lavendulae]